MVESHNDVFQRAWHVDCSHFPLHVVPHVLQLELSEVKSKHPEAHCEYPLTQEKVQALLVHLPTVCAAEVVHSASVQQAGGAVLMQVLPPEQTRWPLGHVPLHAAFWAIHAPLQF